MIISCLLFCYIFKSLFNLTLSHDQTSQFGKYKKNGAPFFVQFYIHYMHINKK